VLAAAAQQPQPFKFEVTSNLVVVNVSVKDRSGKPLEHLTMEDFRLYEDGKLQTVSVFELQRLSSEKLPPLAVAPRPPESEPEPEESEIRETSFKDRRLIILYFDFSGMPPVDQIRAQDAAVKFLQVEMTASDLVSIVTFSSRLRIVADFTDDRERLIQTIHSFRAGDNVDLESALEEAAENEEGHEDFTLDDIEYDIFNTDRRLAGLEEAARRLGEFQEKKALVYLSSGSAKHSVENQSQLRSTINTAVRSNVAFYPIDVRGLLAFPPGGAASISSPKRAIDVFSGKMQVKEREKHYSEQDTLYSLAADTGGKAFLDANDLTAGMVQVQKDIETYYILGYYSTNAAQDGRFRRISVKAPSQPRARLDYRSGYYAPKVWKDFNAADKEKQLIEALQLPNPVLALPLSMEVHYFRLSRGRYFIPVSLRIPGNVVSLVKKGQDETAELDFIGSVKDSRNRTSASVRDTVRVKLSPADAGRLSGRSIQYDAGFTLQPGEYRLKFVARENLNGMLGAFESRFSVPDLDALQDSVRLSSVVWSHQREALSSAIATSGDSPGLQALNPLVQDGRKLIPNVTHVFRRGQNLNVYFEVYDPADEPQVAVTLSLFRGRAKTFESKPVRLHSAPSPGRPETLPFSLQVPLTSLRPGTYTCQLNIVDEAGRKFAFARAPLILLP
jgi:VWFA-related protein